MPREEYERLVENIRTDGALTSSPLVCENEDGSLEILSGHHRTQAAIEIGLNPIEVLVITDPIDEDRKTAIQLSHNAVAGEDNPSVLADMYRSLGLDAKIFSGLTDAVLEIDKLTIQGLSAGVRYEELRFAFLPTDRQSFEIALKRVKQEKVVVATHLARYEDFNEIFDTLLAVKEKKGVVNSALALHVMAQLAMERLDEIEAAKQAAEAEPDDTPTGG